MSIYEKISSFIFNKSFSKEDLSVLHKAPKHKEDFIFSLFDYRQNKTKQLIKYLKNHNDIFLKKEIAYLMSEHVIDYLSDQQELLYFVNTLVIPVPVSKKRLRTRGFNQTQLLAKYFAKNVGGTYTKDLIRKHKTTKKQALIKSRIDRFNNVKGAFSVNQKKKHLLKNRDVIIIDDLVTTGATLLEIKKVLKKNGARNVIAVTIAH